MTGIRRNPTDFHGVQKALGFVIVIAFGPDAQCDETSADTPLPFSRLHGNGQFLIQSRASEE